MAELTPELKTRLAALVAKAERQTSAEFVTLIVRRSLRADAAIALIAAATALLLPGLFWLVGWPVAGWPLYLLQGLLFLTGGATAFLPAANRLVPKGPRLRRASALAHEQFARLGLHRTQSRGAVLLFVALDVRYVEIIADEAALRALPPDSWSKTVEHFTSRVKAGNLEAGFAEALQFLGDRLALALPRQADDKNELPDHLIVQ